MFKSLEIDQWRQYDQVVIDFHDHLTIITGANGSGKTTILNILGLHFPYNWQTNFVSTLRYNRATGLTTYGISRNLKRRLRFMGAEISNSSMVNVGAILYSNGNSSPIQVPSEGGATYQLNFPDRNPVDGLHIQSHRPLYAYAPVLSIPTQPLSRAHFYQEYFNSSLNRQMGNLQPKSPLQIIKESLISLAVFGPGNEYVLPNADNQKALDSFQRILKEILPPRIGFQRISIQVPEVVLETATGDFAIDAMSGGIASIVDIAWRIFTYSPEGGRYVCVIDEPENHLHPELQQSLLPNLIKAFPDVQFVVATHSPFMISAAFESLVYALNYNEDRKVICQKLDTINKSGTANEILRDVLGLPFTMPLWASEKMNSIMAKYANAGVDDVILAKIEAELAASGIDTFIPDVTSVDEKPDAS